MEVLAHHCCKLGCFQETQRSALLDEASTDSSGICQRLSKLYIAKGPLFGSLQFLLASFVPQCMGLSREGDGDCPLVAFSAGIVTYRDERSESDSGKG